MSFIRKRGGSHQLIDTYREGGKVRQRVLANLGHHAAVEDAIAYWEKQLPIMERVLAERRAHLELAEKHVKRGKKARAKLLKRGIYPGDRPPEYEGVSYCYPRDLMPANARTVEVRRTYRWLSEVSVRLTRHIDQGKRTLETLRKCAATHAKEERP